MSADRASFVVWMLARFLRERSVIQARMRKKKTSSAFSLISNLILAAKYSGTHRGEDDLLCWHIKWLFLIMIPRAGFTFLCLAGSPSDCSLCLCFVRSNSNVLRQTQLLLHSLALDSWTTFILKVIYIVKCFCLCL